MFKFKQLLVDISKFDQSKIDLIFNEEFDKLNLKNLKFIDGIDGRSRSMYYNQKSYKVDLIKKTEDYQIFKQNQGEMYFIYTTNPSFFDLKLESIKEISPNALNWFIFNSEYATSPLIAEATLKDKLEHFKLINFKYINQHAFFLIQLKIPFKLENLNNYVANLKELKEWDGIFVSEKI